MRYEHNPPFNIQWNPIPKVEHVLRLSPTLYGHIKRLRGTEGTGGDATFMRYILRTASVGTRHVHLRQELDGLLRQLENVSDKDRITLIMRDTAHPQLVEEHEALHGWIHRLPSDFFGLFEELIFDLGGRNLLNDWETLKISMYGSRSDEALIRLCLAIEHQDDKILLNAIYATQLDGLDKNQIRAFNRLFSSLSFACTINELYNLTDRIRNEEYMASLRLMKNEPLSWKDKQRIRRYNVRHSPYVITPWGTREEVYSGGPLGAPE